MTVSMVAALNAALRDSLSTDPSVVLLGEDIGKLGGVFRVTDGLERDFGAERVVTTPLGEAGIVGSAVGLAMAGFRPVCEIQFDGFVFPAMNQIVTQLAKYRHRSSGVIEMPVVIRIPVGGGIGAIEHHSESPEAYFMHTAGLRVVCPSTPQDAYDLLSQSIASDDPVVFLEPKRAYWNKGEFSLRPPAASLANARVTRSGTHITVAAYGGMMSVVTRAADILAQSGIDVEIIDLRSLSPLDDETVCASVRRTHRLIVVHEASPTAGAGAELAARVQANCFFELESPVTRVTGYDTPYPASRLEEDWLPNVDRILDAVTASLAV